MKKQDFRTDNLIALMRDVLAGPVLSEGQRAGLSSRIHTHIHKSRLVERKAISQVGEGAQLYLWPVETRIVEERGTQLRECFDDWRLDFQTGFTGVSTQVEHPITPKPRIVDETESGDTQSALFPIHDELLLFRPMDSMKVDEGQLFNPSCNRGIDSFDLP